MRELPGAVFDSRAEVWIDLGPVTDDAGIDRVGALLWRHLVHLGGGDDFMATEMLHAGIPLPIVARRLDHQRPSTTLNFYAQAVSGVDAQAAQTLEALLESRSPR